MEIFSEYTHNAIEHYAYKTLVLVDKGIIETGVEVTFLARMIIVKHLIKTQYIVYLYALVNVLIDRFNLIISWLHRTKG